MSTKFLNRNYNLSLIILLFFAGVIVYSNTFLNSFHFDDESSIIRNYAIKDIRNLRAIWNFWPTRFFTYVSIAFNYHWDGLRVWGYHVFNFYLHVGSAILVWWLTKVALTTPTIKNCAIAAHAKPLAFFTAAVFLLHPIQTQPVNYIIQRATLLAAFFYIASVGLYVKARLKQEEGPGSNVWKVYYGSSLLAAFMGVFSKEITISLPLVICLCEFYFFKTKKSFNWKYAIPFFVIILIIPLTMLITQSVDFKGMRRVSEDYPGIASGHYFLTQLRVMVTYLRLVVIPLNQNLDYDYPVAKSIFEIPVIASALFLLLILLSGMRLINKYKLVSFSMLWFFITLFPESSIIPIADVIFEHRLYLPMAGFSLFLVSGLYYLFKGKAVQGTVIMLSLLAATYSIMTYQRNKVWKNEFTLWDDAQHKSPQKARPYNNRGYSYQVQGDLDQALRDYNKAIEIQPKYPQAYDNRGYLYQVQGDLDQALRDHNKAIEIRPRFPEAYNNRGYLYQVKGDLDQALRDYNKAIEIRPKYAEAYNNRGNVFVKQGGLDQALQDYTMAIKINPNSAEFYYNRGNIYQEKGNPEQALSDYTRAIKIEPSLAQACNNRMAQNFGKTPHNPGTFQSNQDSEPALR